MVTPVTSTTPCADAVFNFFLIQHWPFSFPSFMASSPALPNFTCAFLPKDLGEILRLWQCPFPQALLHLQLHSHSCGHWGVISWCRSRLRDRACTSLHDASSSLPRALGPQPPRWHEDEMGMKAGILMWSVMRHRQIFPATPCEGGQPSCDLLSESGVQVLRKGDLDLTEQNTSSCAIQSHHRNPIISSTAIPNCVVRAACCTTHGLYYLTENKKEKRK